MPSPKDKKAASVNIVNLTKKPEENVETKTKEPTKQELPDWVKQAKSEMQEQEPVPIEKYEGKVDKKLVTDEQPKQSTENRTPELTFGGTSKRQDNINKQAQEAVSKVASGEAPTEEESKNAQSSLSEMKQKYSDERMKALAQTHPDKFSTIATIMSALVTAATGGAIPFIPFNAITGNDQKIAYFNKINATYASQMNDLALDVNKLEQQRAKEATSNEETLKNAQQMAKEEGARKTDADVYKAEKEKRNQAELLTLENELRKDYSTLNTEQQQQIMSLAQDLENKSYSEATRYLVEEAQSGKYDNDALKLIAKMRSAVNSGKTPNQVAAATANAWTDIGTKAIYSVGGMVRGNK